MEKIRLGVSECLLGHNVRYDGSHKLDRFLVDTLGNYVEYTPVCPEVECGMPVPREAMRLEGDPSSPRLVTSKTKQDMTDKMTEWASRRVKELEKENFHGFIFKSNSPSSGMERVKVYDRNGIPWKKGIGIFAAIFKAYFPLLPVEDDGRLHDPVLRENFIERIFIYKRWRDIALGKKKLGELVDFHTRHKLQIMAHSPQFLRSLGALVAQGKEAPIGDVFASYQQDLMMALKLRATVKKHTNVLQHILGYFKKQLSADEKQEMLGIIEDYHDGFVPLIVPITLINHYVRKFDQPYLQDQYYLRPHPIELQLRNHV